VQEIRNDQDEPKSGPPAKGAEQSSTSSAPR
jgi:hypothetical protein